MSARKRTPAPPGETEHERAIRLYRLTRGTLDVAIAQGNFDDARKALASVEDLHSLIWIERKTEGK